MNSEDLENNYTINYSFRISNSEEIERQISDNPAENIILVGTAHVSEKSITEVEETIERERPDAVAVELCPARYQALTQEVEVKNISAKDILGSNKPYYFLVHWLLAFVQKKIGKDLGVDPGAEMLEAINKAESIGARIVLIDRDIQITLQRFWQNMSLWEKLKMIGALVGASIGLKGEEIDIESVTDKDVVTQLMEELRHFAPSVARVFVDERDAYMARNLLEAGKSSRIVAVVGAGHREGITKYLEHPETLPAPEELVSVNQKRLSVFKMFGLVFVTLAIAMFLLVILAIINGTLPLNMLLIALGYWFIINGILSAAGAALAKGHPKSIITAFLVAWLTSLNPMMAAGWFAGIMEAKQNPPSTEDFRKIIEAETFGQMYNNRLFRILLVAALANLGSMIGTFLGIYVIFSITNINPTIYLQDFFNNIL